MNLSYGPGYFLKWLFNQDEAWLSADGEWHTLQAGHENTMHVQHVLNTILMLERTALDVHRTYLGASLLEAATPPEREAASKWLVNTKLYKALKALLVSELDG